MTTRATINYAVLCAAVAVALSVIVAAHAIFGLAEAVAGGTTPTVLTYDEFTRTW